MRLMPAATAIAAIAAALLLGACSPVEYKDTNPAVDARPECDKASAHPGDVVAPWCTREQSATWTSGGKDTPVDFGKKSDSK